MKTKSVKCPICKNDQMQKITSNGSNFYKCSNYLYCTYKIIDIDTAKKNIRYPDCGAYLTQKSGKYGFFYGCSNYPHCKYTRNIK